MSSQRQKTERFILGLFLDIVIPQLPDRGVSSTEARSPVFPALLTSHV
jgi:hypothetical protein